MPLIRGIARTAVIAGTATAVSNRVSRRQAQRWADQDAQEYYEEQGPPPPPQQQYQPQPAPPPQPDKYEQLRQLAELKDQGILTDAEFAAQKAKVLAT
jgi:hypothetical protein